MISREIPKYLISRRYISVMIAFIVVFSALFMLIYEPFSLAVWFSTSNTLQFSITILFYVAAIVILIISRSLMYALQDRYMMTIIRYLWWLMGENLAISLLYTILTISLFSEPGVTFPSVGVRALFCVTLILAIPNGIILFFSAYRTKCEELEAVSYQLQRSREECRRLELMTEHEKERRVEAASQAAANERSPRMINFHDNGGTLRLTISEESLYYLESEDNYIKVNYKHNDKIATYMLRCRTKSVEESLQGTSLRRCHRSYIVNINKIRFVGEEHRMHFITLDDDSIRRIPLSKSYYESVLSSLNMAQRSGGHKNIIAQTGELEENI
ncbi:MAG: LytTR family transcriptional regulator [Alistipes sp.]|nr:LytTR family transcriptional regulator [Alistipes sp.]